MKEKISSFEQEVSHIMQEFAGAAKNIHDIPARHRAIALMQNLRLLTEYMEYDIYMSPLRRGSVENHSHG